MIPINEASWTRLPAPLQCTGDAQHSGRESFQGKTDQETTKRPTIWPRDQQKTKRPIFWREENIPGHLDSSRGKKSNFFVKNKSQKAEHVCLSHTSAILDQYWGQRSQMGSYVMCHYRYTHVLWIHIRGMNDEREGLLWNKKVLLTLFLAEGHLQKSELDFGRT